MTPLSSAMPGMTGIDGMPQSEVAIITCCGRNFLCSLPFVVDYHSPLAVSILFGFQDT